MAQRICQRDRIVSPNLVKFCKDLHRIDSEGANTTSLRAFDSWLAPLVRPPGNDAPRLFESPVCGFISLSVPCGIHSRISTPNVYRRTRVSASTHYDTHVSTSARTLSTLVQQHSPTCIRSQQLLPQHDLKSPDDNHQDSSSLLSSETVIKYYSHKNKAEQPLPV